MRSASSTRRPMAMAPAKRLDHLAQDVAIDDANTRRHRASPNDRAALRCKALLAEFVEGSSRRRDRAGRASRCPGNSVSSNCRLPCVARNDMKMHMRVDHHQHQIVDLLIAHEIPQARLDVMGDAAPIPQRPRRQVRKKPAPRLWRPSISEPKRGLRRPQQTGANACSRTGAWRDRQI